MILVNGGYQDQIHINDRGFQYGDGLFETIEVRQSKPIFLNRHLARLESGCSRLRISPPDNVVLRSEIQELSKNTESAVLKIIITRGQGGRGYCPPQPALASRVLAIYPFPDFSPVYSTQGIQARFCSALLGSNSLLAGIKHLNRLEQIMARSEWDDPEIQEGFLCDQNGFVIEGTMSNIFFFKRGILHTPSLKSAGVEGIIKAVIKQLCAENKVIYQEGNYVKEDILAADEVFICNSIIGIWPVIKVESFNSPLGKLTQQIQAWLRAYKARDGIDEP